MGRGGDSARTAGRWIILRMLADAPRALVIHGNYLDDEELAFLAANRERMSLVYCPRTHAYFEHPPYPLAKHLKLGVRVALGTDSRASNPDLDLLAEMRHVAQNASSDRSRRCAADGDAWRGQRRSAAARKLAASRQANSPT